MTGIVWSWIHWRLVVSSSPGLVVISMDFATCLFWRWSPLNADYAPAWRRQLHAGFNSLLSHAGLGRLGRGCLFVAPTLGDCLTRLTGSPTRYCCYLFDGQKFVCLDQFQSKNVRNLFSARQDINISYDSEYSAWCTHLVSEMTSALKKTSPN